MSHQQYLYKCPNHSANLNSMRLNNKWCDVIIKVDGREFHAHKVVIAANIKYFDMMFSSDSFRESKDGVIIMQSIHEKDLEAILSYSYTGEILLTNGNALDLLEVANYIGEDGIKDACIEFLKKILKTSKELALRAYKFASTIDCLALINEAKSSVLANFEYCSQTVDYLTYDYEHLTEIFSDAKKQPAKLQGKIFEGIARWIMHDVKERRIHMNDLLNCIDVVKLTSDYLIEHLYKSVIDYDDEHDIIKCVMSCYHNNKSQRMGNMDEGRTLLVIGFINNNQSLNFQYCNLTERKWSSLLSEENIDYMHYTRAAAFNNKLYYTFQDSQSNVHLKMFDPTIKQSTTLYESFSTLSSSAMCTCSKYLYLCGGITHNDVCSNQVLRYDPLTNLTDALSPLRAPQSEATAIFYEGCLHILGGQNDDASDFKTVAKYDFNTNEWTALPSMCGARFGHAVAVLDEKLYACGGWPNYRSVEVYDPTENSWQLLASMNKQRHKFTLIPHEGKLLAIGGDVDNTAEVYDPCENEWHIDQQLAVGMQIRNPQGGLISSSCFAND